MPAVDAAPEEVGRPRARAKLAAGSVVGGRYLLEARIGEGGMGTVYRARDTSSGAPVAIKIVKESAEELGPRFVREARITASLTHPSMVRVHDVLEAEGSPVIVMELLSGESLHARLARVGKMTVYELAPIALAVVDAVRAAHEAGILHRDLKPDNVFLCARPSGFDVKLLDFGIAKVREDAAAPAVTAAALTRTGQLLGTPQYMAPEQIFGEKDVDDRADIWALGVIFYEALSGERPFDGENAGQVFKAIALGPMVPLAKKAPSAPPAVAEMVDRMLAHSRRERLSDLSEVDRILLPFADRGARPAERRSRRRWIVGFAAGALLAATLPLVSARRARPAAAPSTPVLEAPVKQGSSTPATSDVTAVALNNGPQPGPPTAQAVTAPPRARRKEAVPPRPVAVAPSTSALAVTPAIEAPPSTAPESTLRPAHRSGTLRRDEF